MIHSFGSFLENQIGMIKGAFNKHHDINMPFNKTML